MVVFGLFHGLVFLPVMLSLFGPLTHHAEDEETVVEDAESPELPEESDSGDKPRKWSTISAQFEGACKYSPTLAASRNSEDGHKKPSPPVTVLSMRNLRDREEFGGIDNASFKQP